MEPPPIVVDPNVPVVTEEHLLDERPDLDVHEDDDVVETLAEVPTPKAFVTTGSQWRDGYLDGLETGDRVTTVGAGYDKFPVDDLEEQGVRFTNTPHAPTAAVAEHAFAMAFSYTRRLWHFRDRQRNREWDRPWLDVTDLAGDVAAACLDVTDPEPLPRGSPLWERDDVLVTPHAAGHTEKFPCRFLDTFLPQYDRWRAGGELRNRIA